MKPDTTNTPTPPCRTRLRRAKTHHHRTWSPSPEVFTLSCSSTSQRVSRRLLYRTPPFVATPPTLEHRPLLAVGRRTPATFVTGGRASGTHANVARRTELDVGMVVLPYRATRVSTRR